MLATASWVESKLWVSVLGWLGGSRPGRKIMSFFEKHLGSWLHRGGGVKCSQLCFFLVFPVSFDTVFRTCISLAPPPFVYIGGVSPSICLRLSCPLCQHSNISSCKYFVFRPCTDLCFRLNILWIFPKCFQFAFWSHSPLYLIVNDAIPSSNTIRDAKTEYCFRFFAQRGRRSTQCKTGKISY